MDKDLDHFSTLIDECKSNILQLEQKLEEVRQKHKLLIQRGRHAAETKQARTVMKQADGSHAFQRFNDLEKKVERMEAEAEMSSFGISGSRDSSIEHEFDKTGIRNRNRRGTGSFKEVYEGESVGHASSLDRRCRRGNPGDLRNNYTHYKITLCSQR